MPIGLSYGLFVVLPGLLLAQAEPAPPEPKPPAPAPIAPAPPPEPPAPPAYFIGLGIGGGHRLATEGEPLQPTYGMSVASLFGRRYASLALGPVTLDLGAAVHFDYQRYVRTVNIPIVRGGVPGTYEDLRSLSYYEFSALQTLALPLGPLRLLAAVGAGLALGHFSTLEPALRPGEARMVRPLVRGSLGADVQVGSQGGRLGVGISMAVPLFEPTFSTAMGQRLQVFGDRLSANVIYSYAF